MFTIEEITLMKMYSGFRPERKQILQNLEKVLPHFTEVETEMKELTDGVVRKLTAMNDRAFEELNFNLALDEEENV
ncbi:MAG: transposon-transfer assisting family protein [Oscillospiraceae bacterium]